MASMTTPSLPEKLRALARLHGDLLRNHGIGHPQWYAETLVAAAFDGTIERTNSPKLDVRTPQWGRVQVKSRVRGTDGAQNRVNFGKYGVGDFDHAAVVLFAEDYRIVSAVILDCANVLPLVMAAGHVPLANAVAHACAVDIAAALRDVGGELQT